MRRIKWVGVMSFMTISLYGASHDDHQVSQKVGTQINYDDLDFELNTRKDKKIIKDFSYARRHSAFYKNKKYFVTEFTPELCLREEKFGQEVKDQFTQGSQLDHPHVVRFEGYSLKIDMKEGIGPCYMTQKYDFTLEDYFKIKDKASLSEAESTFKTAISSLTERLSILRQILSGLQYLQSKNVRFTPTPSDIIFHSLHPTTVKIDNYWSFPLLKEASGFQERRVETIYRAPEIYHDKNADPFAFGLAMLMWEILYQKKIHDVLQFPSEADTQVFLAKAKRPSINEKPIDWPVEKEESWKRLASLICKAWAHNPADRATLEEIDAVIEGVLVVDLETPKDAT